MCYVVAKNANKIGSVAIRMKLGKPVVQLKAEMNSRYLNKGIQLNRLHTSMTAISRTDRRQKFSMICWVFALCATIMMKF